MDFEKFSVYIKSQKVFTKLQPYLKDKTVNREIRDQLYRASTSILLNIAEGAGKYSKADKKNFYVIARGSAKECIAIIKIIQIEENMTEVEYNGYYYDFLEIVKMLSGLIKKMSE